MKEKEEELKMLNIEDGNEEAYKIASRGLKYNYNSPQLHQQALPIFIQKSNQY